MSVTFTGRDGVSTYCAVAIKHGLLMYARHKMKPNRAWTPTAMLKAAGSITGKTYRRGAYLEAAQDLEAWLAVNGITGE
jgi:hypothetical protein